MGLLISPAREDLPRKTPREVKGYQIGLTKLTIYSGPNSGVVEVWLEADMLWQIGSWLAAIILSFWFGHYFYRKSERLQLTARDVERNRVRTEFAEQLAKQLVRRVLGGEPPPVDRLHIEASLTGKLKRLSSTAPHASAEEVDVVLHQAFSIIDEQEFIDGKIKDQALRTLRDCLSKREVMPEEHGAAISPASSKMTFAAIHLPEKIMVTIGAAVTALAGGWLGLYLTLHVDMKVMSMMAIMTSMIFSFLYLSERPGTTLPTIVQSILRAHASANAALTVAFLLIWEQLPKDAVWYQPVNKGLPWLFIALPAEYILAKAVEARWSSVRQRKSPPTKAA